MECAPSGDVAGDVQHLEVFGALLFGLCALLYGRRLHLAPAPKSQASSLGTGLRMRRALSLWLVAANAGRSLALVAEVALAQAPVALGGWGAPQQCWLLDLVGLAPSLLFLSAFSTLVLFWAQLHYTTTIVPIPLMDCFFACANVACYLLVAVVAVGTFVLKAYSHLWTYLTCIIGFLNAAVALSFLYYGLMVFWELKDTSRKRMPQRRLTERVLVLSVLCPIMLLLRGAVYLAWGLAGVHRSQLLDLLFFFTSEWLPSLAAFLVLNPVQQRKDGLLFCAQPGEEYASSDALNDSTDSEPLLRDCGPTTPPPRTLAGERGLTWKQLYPQPAAV